MVLPACGGGAGGPQAGQGLVLLSFAQNAVDNAVLNTRLEFDFSSEVDPSSITSATIEIREGPSFGWTVPGAFITQGSTVIFEPALASLCDQSDAGLKPDTEYRVQVIGFPEEFAVRNMAGQALSSTQTYQFHTRSDTDPDKYQDQIPNVGPAVLSTSPANGEQAVAVRPGNIIQIQLSENVNPCSVNDVNVLVDMYESGDPSAMVAVPGSSPVRYSGFSTGGDIADQTADPFSWGADGTTSYASAPRRILCEIHMHQDFGETRLDIEPLLGWNPDPNQSGPLFPENALIVVQLTFNIVDYGGSAMTPVVFSFTTENLAPQTGEYLIENKGETPYDGAQTTAAVHPDPRAPERVQGFMLFAGDGDNGGDLYRPTLPQKPGCAPGDDLQLNDNTVDNFDPGSDVVLDTGSTPNTCFNSTDGSTAVVWEFNSFRIRSGRTVRIIGKNPAIILVQGDIVIESGGRLLVYGDNNGGAPQSRGGNGQDRYTQNVGGVGGTGVAGGGDGGDSKTVPASGPSWAYGQDGFAGFGSEDYDGSMSPTGSGHGGVGAGLAGSPTGQTSSSPWDGSPVGGGGAGHTVAGTDGDKKNGTNTKHQLPARGDGGDLYGEESSVLLTPEAGSGGGSSGAATLYTYSTYASYGASGGAGGAGGGFVDLTSNGNVEIQGDILAVGSSGGNGDGWSAYGASSGGGGGSGGGIRILSSNDIIMAITATVSTAGGLGGNGYAPYSLASGRNDGGDGSVGRIAMEDADSVIAGMGGANVTPSEGNAGFYRGIFNPGRFQGGGLEPRAVTGLIVMGNYSGFNPVFIDPVQNYGAQTDFKVGIPVATAPPASETAMLIEAQGFEMNPDGSADMGTASGWVSVGYFRDSGVEGSPTWALGHPADKLPRSADNTGGAGGFTELNTIAGVGQGFEYVQFRITIYLPSGVGPFDAGAYLDDWLIRYTNNQ